MYLFQLKKSDIVKIQITDAHYNNTNQQSFNFCLLQEFCPLKKEKKNLNIYRVGIGKKMLTIFSNI